MIDTQSLLCQNFYRNIFSTKIRKKIRKVEWVEINEQTIEH